MKKVILTILYCMILDTVFTQTAFSRVRVFIPYGEVKESIRGANVQGVSFNGEWAVGFGTEYSQHSFIWNRTTGEFSLITGSYLDIAYAYSVSNDGTVVGAFYEDTEGDGGTGYMLPGIWKDGVWTKLPMENSFVPVEGLEASVNGEACFISGDGAVITGYIQSPTFSRSFYENGTLVETRNVSFMRPAVWTKKSDGSYKLEYKPSTMPTGDEFQQGIWSRYGSSQDGTVIPVVADHPSGSRSPAVVINGQLTRIYGKEDIDLNTDETQYFFDGVSVTVSPNGKYVPGYWSATGSAYDLKAFVYDTEAGATEELENWGAATVALDDGSLFGFDGNMGTALYRNADKSFNGTFGDYLDLYYGGYSGNIPQTILSASGDGKTIGGWYTEADAIGAVLYPSIVVLSGEPNVEPVQTANYYVDFCDGIPEDFTLACYDEMLVNSQNYKKLNVSKEWTTSLVDSNDGKAAVSASRRMYDMPTDNWMITPRLTLPAEDVCLKWTSRAIHYHLRDGYKVMISTTGNEYYDFEELYSVEEEEYLWTKHYVSLEKYAGKKVYIAFVHNSQNKFLLAIDDMFVGQPTKADFIVEDKTPRFVGNVETAKVQGYALNSGINQDGHNLTCVVNGTEVLEHSVLLDSWKQGIEYPFEFDVPVQVGKTTHYKVMNGNHTLVEDSIICSYYPRTILLENATATWCLNCPGVKSFIQELKERYGDQIVCVEAHWGPPEYGKDPFHYAAYTTGMKVNAYPMIHINRNRDNAIFGDSPTSNMMELRKMLNKPTVAKIEMDVNYGEGGDSVLTSAKVTFANDTDNSTGKYRVGYVLIEKKLQHNSTRQINGVSNISQGEYYYLPSPVPTDMMWYSNVVRNDNKAFLGIKNSLPLAIEGGVEYTVDAKMGIPSTVYNKNNLAIIAIVMDYFTDEVLNVCEVDVVNSTLRTVNYVINGEQYCKMKIEEGKLIPLPEVPIKEGHTFNGWINLPEVMPDEDITVYGDFTVNNYQLTFTIEDSILKTVTYPYGSDVEKIEAPEREGYTFKEWKNLPETMPAKDMVVTGQYNKNSYTVTYMVDGAVYNTQSVLFESELNLLNLPQMDGYTFSGWNCSWVTMPAHDIVINGYFTINSYSLTYILDGEVYKQENKFYGTQVKPIEVPEKEGYTFSGWGEVPATMPSDDLTLVGEYIVNKHSVIYYVDGAVYATFDVDYGSTIMVIADLKKTGYTFSGWSEAPVTMPDHNVIINGNFMLNKYAVKYILAGEVYVTDSITYGEEIALQPSPEREGHTFSGWSEVPITMPSYDIVVNGEYTVNSYQLTYKVDGEVYTTMTVTYGTPIYPIANPIKEGYIFSGWSEVPETMPAEDFVVTGSFEVDGIEAVVTNGFVDVYTLQGVMVKRQISINELKEGLAKGIYIINGRKVVIR